MADKAPTTSRRRALAILSASCLVPASALAVQPSPSGISPELARLFAARKQAEAAYKAHDKATTPTMEAYRAARAAIPHVKTRNSFTSMSGEVVHLTTENEGSVKVARRVLADIEAGKIKLTNDDRSYHDTVREVIAATEQREVERQRLADSYGVDAILEETERLSEASAGIADQIVAFRSAGIADLAAKAYFYHEERMEEETWATNELLGDILQLAGRA